jgi:short-subunit dehydrogenase
LWGLSLIKDSYFQDKVVVITGASSGIGLVAALTLSKLNAKVVLASRREDKLRDLVQNIHSTGGQGLAIKTDVASSESVKDLVEQTLNHWGRVDILIANAGQYIRGKFSEIDEKRFEQSMAVNFFGTLHVIKSVLPHMLRQGSGHIVIMNSLDAKKGIVGDGPYVSAKSALDGFGDVLRQELSGSGIHVTSVYPARVDTPMIEHLQVPWISPKISPEKAVDAMIKAIERKKSIVVVPAIYFPLGALNSLFPRVLDWLYAKFRLEGKEVER